MKFEIITFGCQMNVNDSDWLSRALVERGFEPSDDRDEVDFFIVNTCSVREKPELKVYSQLGRLAQYHRRNPDVFVAVGGCVAQQVGLGFRSRFPFVRLVFGTDGTPMVPQAIERLVHEPGLKLSLLDFSEDFVERDPALDPASAASSPQAFVNIMQGCDNYCAYCIVPYVRGRQKSRSGDAVLDECRAHVARGVRELTLLGQNVNSYGLDKYGDGTTFAELLRRVAAIPGLARLRFTTSHPKDLSDEVIAAFGEIENLCPYLHLPLQSGSDRILKAMGRKYDLAHYYGLVDKLRAARPDIVLSTDLIVGFPGETDEDFKATLAAMERVRYSSSFSFRYSDRPGVRAEKITPKVAPEVAAERLSILQELQNSFTNQALAAMVDKQTTVLIEGPSKVQDAERGTVGAWRGHDAYNHSVNVLCHTAEQAGGMTDMTGRMVAMRVTQAKKHSLFGKQEGEPW